MTHVHPIATMLFYMMAAHALCDYALQSDFMAKFKSRRAESSVVIWPYVLLSHALMHGAAVTVITQSLVLGLCETAAHAAIDFAKCEGWANLHEDQFLHIACKVTWLQFL